jgi:hypothetical protein
MEPISPLMGIYPFHFRDGSIQHHYLVPIELCREGVMRPQWGGGCKQA